MERGILTQEYRHEPVMLGEVLESLRLKSGSVVCDCTLGGAGHSVKMAAQVGETGLLLGVDQDDMALEAAGARLDREVPGVPHQLLKGKLLCSAEVPGVDGFLFDLGVSSPQLDIPGRGFSYNEDAPLDMRMDPGNNTLNAAEVINTYNEHDLARILRVYGEEKFASQIAREVNHELDVLERGLDAATRWLNPGGRICVISYHSLEDRIVKNHFKEMSQGCTCPPEIPVCVCGNVPILKVITRKPLVAQPDEVARNPRARSAKIREARPREIGPPARTINEA